MEISTVMTVTSNTGKVNQSPSSDEWGSQGANVYIATCIFNTDLDFLLLQSKPSHAKL